MNVQSKSVCLLSNHNLQAVTPASNTPKYFQQMTPPASHPTRVRGATKYLQEGKSLGRDPIEMISEVDFQRPQRKCMPGRRISGALEDAHRCRETLQGLGLQHGWVRVISCRDKEIRTHSERAMPSVPKFWKWSVSRREPSSGFIYLISKKECFGGSVGTVLKEEEGQIKASG